MLYESFIRTETSILLKKGKFILKLTENELNIFFKCNNILLLQLIYQIIIFQHYIMKISTFYRFFAIIFIFSFSQASFAQNKVDSTLLSSALTLTNCVQNAKKYIGKDVILNATVISSREITMEKDKVFFLLELDDLFPNNKVSVLINEEEADALGFSRFIYHQKKVLIFGKLEKNKKFRDEFGNPRLVIRLTKMSQIVMY